MPLEANDGVYARNLRELRVCLSSPAGLLFKGSSRPPELKEVLGSRETKANLAWLMHLSLSKLSRASLESPNSSYMVT